MQDCQDQTTRDLKGALSVLDEQTHQLEQSRAQLTHYQRRSDDLEAEAATLKEDSDQLKADLVSS